MSVDEIQREKDFQLIDSIIIEAEHYGLTREIMYFSLKAMKENSKLTIEEAVAIGYSEWIK